MIRAVGPRFTLNWTRKKWQRLTGASGGDFTVHYQDDPLLRVLIGTVAGQNARVSTTAALVHPMIECDLAGGVDDHTLRRWSSVIDQLFRGCFVAVTCLEIDLSTGAATIWNGGHPAVVIRREDGIVRARIDADGMPLGWVDDDAWRSPSPRRVLLGPGEEIICRDGDAVSRCRPRRGARSATSWSASGRGWPFRCLNGSTNKRANPKPYAA